MKTIYLIFALFVGCLVIPSTGCKSPSRTLYTVEASAHVTIETALKAWNDHLGNHAVTLADERRVKDAFDKYKSAMVFAVRASQSYATLKNGESEKAANVAYADAIDSLSALVNLLRSFGVKI
jgi:hypothetical protein